MKEIYKQFSVILSPKAKRKFVVLTLLCIVGAVFETLGISLIFPYITVIADPESLYEQEWLRPVWNFLNLPEPKLLLLLSVLLILVYLLKNVFLYWFGIVHRKYVLEECFSTTEEVYKLYLKKPYSFFLNRNSTDISNVINVYVSKAFVLLGIFIDLFSELAITGLLLLLMCLMDFGVTILILVFYGGISFLIKQLIDPKLTKIGQISNENYDYMVKNVTQAVRGIQDVKLLQREEQLLNEYDYYVAGNIKAELKKTALSTLPRRGLEILSVAMMLVCVLFFGDSMSKELLFAQLSTFAMVLIRIMPGINRINSCLNQISYYKPSLMKLSEDVFCGEEIEEKAEEKEPLEFKKEITVENVSFRYNENAEVLRGINVTIPKGTVVGIRGVSGGGKTTFANLVLGLLPLDEGKICVDGKDIQSNRRSWFSLISYIPQSVFLLDGTVLENVVFLREVDEKKAWNALARAKLKEFVEALPQGIHTQIGERGIRISGGQKQRLGIARAIYHDSEVFIFDEPTAALDQKLEEEVMEAIYSLEDRTILLIAHRLNTLKNCDVIYEVKDKQIIEVKNDKMD